ncbi:MAG: hydroxymethylglutaryl-CoA reductase, degradative [Caldilineaceae bacterium]|nr:hydroxymethylglutaryl-CoA reductase, degradative [Caldilineaceae bacterium]
MTIPAPETPAPLAGLHRLEPDARLDLLQQQRRLDQRDRAILDAGLSLPQADAMSENVVGRYALPYGIATNFLVDGEELAVPMAVEEPSVVAAASKAAKLARTCGGFRTEATPNLMGGHIQLVNVPDIDEAQRTLAAAERELLAHIPTRGSLLARGGGPRSLTTRHIPHSEAGPILLVELTMDVADAMGANIVNTTLEALAPLVAELTGGEVVLSILSNLCVQRLATAEVLYTWNALADSRTEGRNLQRRIVQADALAQADPHRAATHNKGILNGVEAVAMATGNDCRAVAAAAHAWAAGEGRYRGLTRWMVVPDADALPRDSLVRTRGVDPAGPLLHGRLTLPLALGVAGHSTRAHPLVPISLKLLGNPDSRRLARIAAAVGLAQNLAALLALVDTGIQAGHMRLHARQVALAAGVPAGQVARVVAEMVASRRISTEAALSFHSSLAT